MSEFKKFVGEKMHLLGQSVGCKNFLLVSLTSALHTGKSCRMAASSNHEALKQNFIITKTAK